MFSGLASGRWRLRAVGANSQPAFVLYKRTASGTHEAFGLTVLTLTADQITAGVCFLDPTLAAAFGQPAVI